MGSTPAYIAGKPAHTLVLRHSPDTFCKTSPASLFPTSSTLEKPQEAARPFKE